MKLSQASTSTPRAPSMDHIAISTAPVSEAGTIPSTYVSGMPRIFLLRSMTSASLFLPILARCDRPSAAFLSASKFHPGRLAQGPEEKQGFLGVKEGFIGYFSTIPGPPRPARPRRANSSPRRRERGEWTQGPRHEYDRADSPAPGLRGPFRTLALRRPRTFLRLRDPLERRAA